MKEEFINQEDTEFIFDDKYTIVQNEQRIKLLKVNNDNEMGGTCRFKNLCYNRLKKLIELGYIRENNNQHDFSNLKAKHYLEFLRTHRKFKAHGYIVSNERDDRRITIEGLDGWNVSDQDIIDFEDFQSCADNCYATNKRCYSWHD